MKYIYEVFLVLRKIMKKFELCNGVTGMDSNWCPFARRDRT